MSDCKELTQVPEEVRHKLARYVGLELTYLATIREQREIRKYVREWVAESGLLSANHRFQGLIAASNDNHVVEIRGYRFNDKEIITLDVRLVT